jgi:hypothetical protein
MLRPASLLPALSQAFDAPLWPSGSLLPTGACYRALRRLPGQDFHLLEERVFQDAPCQYFSSPIAHNAVRPRLILIASLTSSIVASLTLPRGLISRTRSTARIWLNTATEVTERPVFESAASSTCTGLSGKRTVEVIGATIVTSDKRLERSFWITSEGRVFWISRPTAGSSAVR